MIFLVAVVLVFAARLFYIQVLNDSFKSDANNNSTVHTAVYPTRGLIYDRHGNILVENKTCWNLMVTPAEVEPFDTARLADILGVERSFIEEKMAWYRKYRTRIGYRSVEFIHQMESADYLRFAEVAYQFPGFHGEAHSVRKYPVNAGGNLLGYVSEVDAPYIKKHPEYKSGDYVGRAGIEASMEHVLKGEKGNRIYYRNSRNKIVGSYLDGRMDTDAVPGKDVTTTIDRDLQVYGQQLMAGKIGSIVAIEPSTGEILALVSAPCLDVEKLDNMGKYYKEIASDPLKPMFNRAVQASYPPGSVFKLVGGLIGLQEGTLKPWYEYPCHQGYWYAPGKKVGCHAHRSPLDFEEAIMMSCNSYFCYVFKDIIENPAYPNVQAAFDRWREYVLSFGFGQKLGTDFPYELGGNIPTSDRYDRIYGKRGWKAHTIISLSIGQGEIGCTPMHLANLAAIMANRGYYYTPHIIKGTREIPIDERFTRRNYTLVDTSAFNVAVHGMWRAVNSGWGEGGTATIASVPGLDICGKTGTAQNPHGADNSVFICFAPKDNPRIAVAAYVEHGTWGATWAAPIASLMIEKYLAGEISENRKWLEKKMFEGDLISGLQYNQ